jgi:diguanylate cyclase (GGDEF)-like protein
MLRTRSSPRGRTAVSAVVLLVGLTASVAVAIGWRMQAVRQVQHSFAAQAAGVGSAVTTTLLRMDDLAWQARVLIGSGDEVTNTRLASWYANIDAATRYPGIVGFGYIEFVPASRLAPFTKQLRRDPVPGLPLGFGPLQLVPPGPRSYYCIARLALAAAVNRYLISPGLDFCAIQGIGVLQSVRDSGQFGAFTFNRRIVAVFAPVYRGGTDPSTVARRRVQIAGVVTEIFDVQSILRQALAGHRGLKLSVSRRDVRLSTSSGLAARVGTLSTIASAGTAPGSALTKRLSVDADGRWMVTVSGSPQTGLLTPDVQGSLVLGAGALLSVFAFLLVRTLSRGRARAIRTVHEQTAQLRYMALHDSLTGLPNRRLLLERADQMLEAATRESHTVTAIFIDIDGFKGVNDSFGHAVGDDLLRAIGRRLIGTLRSDDTVGRIGGDEFVVLAAAGPGRDTGQLAERLLDALREPFELGEPDTVLLSVSASLGLATGDRATAEDLLRDADVALYSAKSSGRDRHVVFRQEMHVALQERVSLENDLRMAIAGAQLELDYQPVVELSSGSVIGAEALLRWQHPTRGRLDPGEFILIAEESGLVVELGSWVIARACADAAAWQSFAPGVGVSVNVSARQLEDEGLVATVAHGLRASGLAARTLTLEITETALMQDPDHIARRLEALKHLGVRVAIDDFGTGYSSLAYLHRFPVDSLKIDRTFVAGIGKTDGTESLIRSLIQLSESLGIETVAEGIEEEPQRRLLVKEGCRRGQGFLFARPLPTSSLHAFLRANSEQPSARAGASR